MTAWLIALTGPAVVAVAVLGVLDLVGRTDLDVPRKALWLVAGVVAPPFTALAYVLTRPAGVGSGVVGLPAGTPGLARGPRERLVQRAGRLAARGLFRSVELVAPPDLPDGLPQLWVASHFGALSDPIVLVHALPRPPRFLAADGLFRLPLLGTVLRAAGAIPVRRSQDGGGSANERAFGAAWQALHDGDPVGIFPEGIANDTVQLAPLRTGAARIALGARVPGLVVLPVGIHYQDRAALRRRVLVDVGDLLDVDAWCAARQVAPSADDHALVRALTAELEQRLRTAAPSFADAEEQHALLTAAAVALRGAAGPASYGAQADLADALAELPAERKAPIVDAVAVYRDELDAAGLDDAAVLRRDRRSLRSVVVTVVVGVLLLPPAVLGAVVHAPLVGLVWLTRFLRVAPVTAATVRPVVGIVGAIATWVAVSWWAVRAGLVDGGLTATVVGAIVLPLWGLAALIVAERLSLVVSALHRQARAVARPRRGRVGSDLLAPLRVQRQEVVVLVRAARADGPTPEHR